MVKIRLARVGKRGHATFRIVVTESSRPPKSGALHALGSYDPHTDRVQVDADRVRWYLARGAQVSPTVHNLLVGLNILSKSKVSARAYPKAKAAPDAPAVEGTPAPSRASAPEA